MMRMLIAALCAVNAYAFVVVPRVAVKAPVAPVTRVDASPEMMPKVRMPPN